jgi:hypothetical protein
LQKKTRRLLGFWLPLTTITVICDHCRSKLACTHNIAIGSYREPKTGSKFPLRTAVHIFGGLRVCQAIFPERGRQGLSSVVPWWFPTFWPKSPWKSNIAAQNGCSSNPTEPPLNLPHSPENIYLLPHLQHLPAHTFHIQIIRVLFRSPKEICCERIVLNRLYSESFLSTVESFNFAGINFT